MHRIGWSAARAVAALEEVLPPALRDDVLDPARPAPEPDARASLIPVDGHTIDVLCHLTLSNIVVFGHLLTDAECDALIEHARQWLERSTVIAESGASQTHDARTSSGMFLKTDEADVCRQVDASIAALLGWPQANGESLQVLRFAKEVVPAKRFQ